MDTIRVKLCYIIYGTSYVCMCKNIIVQQARNRHAISHNLLAKCPGWKRIELGWTSATYSSSKVRHTALIACSVAKTLQSERRSLGLSLIGEIQTAQDTKGTKTHLFNIVQLCACVVYTQQTNTALILVKNHTYGVLLVITSHLDPFKIEAT